MKSFKKIILTGLVGVLFAGAADAQCETWKGSPDMKKAKVAHQTYRAALKSENYDEAFKNWEIAYAIAPAADGNRDYHYVDGAKIYLHKYENETDKAKKAEYVAKVYELYDAAMKCYADGGIRVFKCKGNDCIDKKVGSIAAKKVYDQYYSFDAPYEEILKTLDVVKEKSGDDIPYYILDVAASVVVYQFQSDLMSKDDAKGWKSKLMSVADSNIAKANKYTPYYTESKAAMEKLFAKVNDSFKSFEEKKAEIRAAYAGSSDPEVIKTTVAKLIQAGAPDNDPFLTELKGKYASYAKSVNAENAAKRQAAAAARQAALDINNPERMAIKAKKAGDFAGAVAKYDEAIAKATDNATKGELYYKKAKVLYRNLGQYSKARAAARKAASLKPGWGGPYMLIGDMYVKSSKSCGDGWNQRLAMIAAVDKYQRAKSVDPSVAGEASSRIAKYSRSLPSKQDAFMRGVTPGGTAKVGCWIGETVKVRTR